MHYAAEDDTREVHLRPAEIARLLKACEDLDASAGGELATIIRLALLTSADRGVLLSGPAHHGRMCRGLLCSDLRIYQDNQTQLYSGEVYLADTKAKGRSRTVPLTDRLCRELLVLAQGKEPGDPVFTILYRDLDYLWKQVKKKAELPGLRFKDLRAQVSQYGEEAGVPLTILSRTMGHSREAMTQRYQQRGTLLQPAQLEAIEAAMLGKSAEGAPQVRKAAN